jgi:hypothetical protein
MAKPEYFELRLEFECYHNRVCKQHHMAVDVRIHDI